MALKILHTSDWHLGQHFHGKVRDDEHERFFEWLRATIIEHEVDVLMVSGDIFDVGYPSNAALKQYYRLLTSLQQTCCKDVVVVGGNHDYISTLNAPKSILEFMNVHVVGGVTENPEDEIIQIKDADGNLSAVVCAIPFLRDKDIRKSIAGESYDDRVEAIKNGIINHYETIAEKASIFEDKNIPIIATGHLFVAGSSLSDSEREIHIGNLSAIPSDRFPDLFNYIALGHLHKPQKVGGKDHIRYSGSPIPLSFSEYKDEKSVIILNFEGKELSESKLLKVPVFRKLIRFKGSIDEVEIAINDYQSDSELIDFAEIQIIEPNYDPIISSRYSLLKEISSIEVIKSGITYSDRRLNTESLFEEKKSLKNLSQFEVFDKLLERKGVEEKEGINTTFKELMDYMREIDD